MLNFCEPPERNITGKHLSRQTTICAETARERFGVRRPSPRKNFGVVSRADKLDGVKFRRQFPIGPSFADFCAPKEFLIVELDGAQHLDSVEADQQRSEYLSGLGYRVVRFWDNDALRMLTR